ncbi:ankyrin repeat-containing domain protein [Tricladium varicosporioides]|nr:ankyrin repeat-containing domain protein [Hymenoscyphus varicosporioides]
MAEALMVLGGIASLLSIIKASTHFSNQARKRTSKNPGDNVTELQIRIESLRPCLEVVESLGDLRGRAHHTISQGEVDIWKSVYSTLDHFPHLLEELDTILMETPGWFMRIIANRQEERSRRVISIFGNLECHLLTLNILIQSVHFFISISTSTTALVPVETLEIAYDENTEDEGFSQGDASLETDSVIENIATETTQNPTSDFISNLLPEFVPYSGKILPQVILKDLIQRLNTEAQKSKIASHYQKAREHKLAVIEAYKDMYYSYGVPSTYSDYEYEKINTDAAGFLVEIFLKRGQFHAAESVQKNILKKLWEDRQSVNAFQSLSPHRVASRGSIDDRFSRRPSAIILAVSDLFKAIQIGNEYQVRDFLTRNPDINIWRDGKTAIMHAVERGNLLIIEMLKEKGANLQDALFYSIRNGFVDMIKPLLALGAKIEELEDGSGLTPLLVAARDATLNITVLEELLYYNANTDAQDAHGWKAIHHIAKNRDPAMMELFLQDRFKADVNAIDKKNQTALHYLAVSNDVDLAKILLRHNAIISMKDKRGRTALQIAINQRTGATEFVELMLRQGMVIEESDLSEASSSMKQLFQGYPDSVIRPLSCHSTSSSFLRIRSRSNRSIDSNS